MFDLLMEEAESDLNVLSATSDEVPYSCCARKAMSSCRHTQLHRYGISTINMKGCTTYLRSDVCWILWLAFTINGLCVPLEVSSK